MKFKLSGAILLFTKLIQRRNVYISKFLFLVGRLFEEYRCFTIGACYDFCLSLDYSREESQMSNFHTTLFKIVLYWCLDLIRHNIGTHLKLHKYIFDISIPFCHYLYLSATLKQCFTEFVG
jgi:hypothetical protein